MTDTKNIDQHAAGSVEARLPAERLTSWGRELRAALASAKPVAAGELPKLQVPVWEDAERAVESGNPTPLDIFVYSQEPAGDSDEAHFRFQLDGVIEYAAAYGQHRADSRPAGGVAATDPSCTKGWYKDYTCRCAACISAAATLAASAAQPAADLSASGLLKLWRQAEEVATDIMPAPFHFAKLLLASSAVQAGAVPVHSYRMKLADGTFTNWTDCSAEHAAHVMVPEFRAGFEVRTLYDLAAAPNMEKE